MANLDELKRLTQKLIPTIMKNEFAFAVTSGEAVWDVYHLERGGKQLTIGLMLGEGDIVIVGLVDRGKLSKEECQEFFDRPKD